MFKILNRKSIVLLFFLILIAVGTVFFIRNIVQQNAGMIEAYVASILEKCSTGASSGERRICYEAQVPKLLDTISLKDAFRITELIQEQDTDYLWCHNMGHQISEREYAKDPAQWKSVMNQCPVGTCSNGCIHGAIQAHFRAASVSGAQLENLIPDLQNLCEEREGWNPTGLEQASCYHELGHLSVYLTGSDIHKSAEICNRVGIKDDGRNFLQTCNEGIFMQVFEPRDPEDFALVYNLIPQKEVLSSCEQFEGEEKGACWERGWGGNASSFCEQFVGEMESACIRESWVVYDKEKIKTPEGVIEFCSYSQDPSEKRKCYNGLFYSLMSLFEFNEERMKKLCTGLPEDVMSQCFANTASRMIETDKDLVARSIAVCEYARNFGVEEQCYLELLYYSDFSFHPGSKELEQYCSHIPEPWNTKCINGG